MKYWAKSRAVFRIVTVALATLLAEVLPVSLLTATPSPGGATIGLAVLIALGVPVTVAWGISRGDAILERRAVRRVALRDFALFIGSCLVVVVAELTLEAAELAPAGFIAARATVTYAGLALAGEVVLGWERAAIVPLIYVLAALLFGGGADVEHPAGWAWIAASEQDASALVTAAMAFAIGLGLHIWASPTFRLGGIRYRG